LDGCFWVLAKRDSMSGASCVSGHWATCTSREATTFRTNCVSIFRAGSSGFPSNIRAIQPVSADDRLTNLELLFTHLERQVADLHQVVLDQRRQIELLQKQLSRLQEGLDDRDDEPQEDAQQ
jgi:uncharacterized coiled-coil protein SlyX